MLVPRLPFLRLDPLQLLNRGSIRRQVAAPGRSPSSSGSSTLVEAWNQATSRRLVQFRVVTGYTEVAS